MTRMLIGSYGGIIDSQQYQSSNQAALIAYNNKLAMTSIGQDSVLYANPTDGHDLIDMCNWAASRHFVGGKDSINIHIKMAFTK